MSVPSLTLPRPNGRGPLVDPLCGSTPQAGEGLIASAFAGVTNDSLKINESK